jgi:hypothetical protein
VLTREEKLRCCLFRLIQNRIVRPFDGLQNDLPEKQLCNCPNNSAERFW